MAVDRGIERDRQAVHLKGHVDITRAIEALKSIPYVTHNGNWYAYLIEGYKRQVGDAYSDDAPCVLALRDAMARRRAEWFTVSSPSLGAIALRLLLVSCEINELGGRDANLQADPVVLSILECLDSLVLVDRIAYF